MGNDIELAHRTKSKGVRYELTPELKSHLALMRREINLTADQMAKAMELNNNTYANIEKKTGSTSITSDILEKFFEIYQQHLDGWEKMPKDMFIIMHLDKCLYTPGKVMENLDKQDWLKALYMKYQTVPIDNILINELSQYRGLRNAILLLNENLHIKLKTKIRYTNEVYINVKEKENKGKNSNNEKKPDKVKYPNYGGKPFWCIRYELSQADVENIISDIEIKKEIKYSLLFSLLVSFEVEGTERRNYDTIYKLVYDRLRDIYGYENIFDKISNINKSKMDIPKGDFISPRATTANRNVNTDSIPLHILKLVSNCINGKDNFINSINVDFSPLYEATPSEIEQFKTELQQLINKYDKERTD